ARGWVVAHLVLQLTGIEDGGAWWAPRTFVGWVVMVGLIVASAQWGRGRWRPGRRWQSVLVGLNAFAVLAAAVFLLWLPGQGVGTVTSENWYEPQPDDGVVVGGSYAENLFVYDAQGQPVDGAQVFDQDGRPVTLGVGSLQEAETWTGVGYDDERSWRLGGVTS
ncbi:hypothetical protein CWIS_15035, partial [Cellulomonas sp. A375-1]